MITGTLLETPLPPSEVKEKSPSSLTEFLEETIENYFNISQFDPAKLLSADSRGKEYTILLLQTLVKLSVFKPLTKKNVRSSRLMMIDLFLKEEGYTATSNSMSTCQLHAIIFSLIHYDQSEILDFLLKQPFFKQYLAKMNPHTFIINLDYTDILTHAICRNAIKTVDVLIAAGWTLSFKHLKKAIENHAEISVNYLLEKIGTGGYEISLAKDARENGNITILNRLLPKQPLFYFGNIIEQLESGIKISSDFLKEIFLILSKAYRFTVNVTEVDAICDAFKKFIEEYYPSYQEINKKIDLAQERSRLWRPLIAASYRSPVDLINLKTCYRKSSDFEEELTYAWRRFLVAKNLVAKKFKMEDCNFPSLGHERPKNSPSFEEMIWIIANFSYSEAKKNNNPKMSSFLTPRLTIASGEILFGQTPFWFGRYSNTFPYIEAMFNIPESDDVIHTDQGYNLLYNKKIIGKVQLFIPQFIEQPHESSYNGFHCEHGKLLLLEETKEICALYKDIFEMDSKWIFSHPKSFREKLAAFLSLIGKLTIMERGSGTVVEIMAAAINIYHKFLLSEFINQVDCLNIVLSTKIQKKLLFNFMQPKSIEPALYNYLKKSEKSEKRKKLIKHFKLGYESYFPKEKTEYVLLSDLDIFNNFMVQSAVPYTAVDKNGNNLLIWAAKYNKKDILSYFENFISILSDKDVDEAIAVSEKNNHTEAMKILIALKQKKKTIKKDEPEISPEKNPVKDSKTSPPKLLLNTFDTEEFLSSCGDPLVPWEEKPLSREELEKDLSKEDLEVKEAPESSEEPLEKTTSTYYFKDDEECRTPPWQNSGASFFSEEVIIDDASKSSEIKTLESLYKEALEMDKKTEYSKEKPELTEATRHIQEVAEKALDDSIEMLFDFDSKGDLCASWEEKPQKKQLRINISENLPAVKFSDISLSSKAKAQFIRFVEKSGTFKPQTRIYGDENLCVSLDEKIALNIYSGTHHQQLDWFLRDFGKVSSPCWVQKNGEKLTLEVLQVLVRDLLLNSIFAALGIRRKNQAEYIKRFTDQLPILVRGEKLVEKEGKTPDFLTKRLEYKPFRENGFFSATHFEKLHQYQPEESFKLVKNMDILIMFLLASQSQAAPIADCSSNPKEYEWVFPPGVIFLCLKYERIKFSFSSKHDKHCLILKEIPEFKTTIPRLCLITSSQTSRDREEVSSSLFPGGKR